MPEEGERMPSRRPRGIAAVWFFILYLFDRLIDTVVEYTRIIVRERDLFFGATLFLVGLLSFESGKYCDGNAADYLSCTRPATFYYFDTLDTVLIVAGSICILVWFMKEKYRARA